MKRIYNHLLGLNNLRKFCGNAEVFGYAKTNFKLEILDEPKKGRVLVLAPHPDDDVFGCGGSLAMHAKQGDEVKIVYFAGNKISQTSNLKPQKYGEGAIKIEEENDNIYSSSEARSSQPSVSNSIGINRCDEAENAAKVLKVTNIEFWGLRENKFMADKKNIARLKKVIEEYKPEIIYCPSFTDTNPDHYEVAKTLCSAMSNVICNMSNVSILLYEIWTPIFANRLIKIDSVIEQKKAAILCHKSQLSDRSYFDAIIGLNQYRAGMFNAGKYAEGFAEMSVELYVKLFKKFQLD